MKVYLSDFEGWRECLRDMHAGACSIVLTMWICMCMCICMRICMCMCMCMCTYSYIHTYQNIHNILYT